MKEVSFITNSLLEASEYRELIEIAKEQQLAAAVAKIDEFNEMHDILIREVEKQDVVLAKKRKLLALKNARRSQIQN